MLLSLSLTEEKVLSSPFPMSISIIERSRGNFEVSGKIPFNMLRKHNINCAYFDNYNESANSTVIGKQLETMFDNSQISPPQRKNLTINNSRNIENRQLVKIDRSKDLYWKYITTSKESDLLILHQATPRMSTHCSNLKKPNHLTLNYKVRIKYPSQWSIIDPSPIKSSSFGFGLYKNMRKRKLNIHGTSIVILSKSRRLGLIPTIKSAYSAHLKLYGPLPQNKLYIIETNGSYSPVSSGIISFNRPRQNLFDSIQKKVLNWNHWVIIALLSYQWHIEKISSWPIKDQWFLMGLIDFSISEALRSISLRNNLFNNYEKGISLIDMNYSYIQDLNAAFLRKKHPYLRLTDDSNSSLKFNKNRKMAYIRQVMALRQARSILGDRYFRYIIKRFIQSPHQDVKDPKDFLELLNESSSKIPYEKRVDTISNFRKWWTSFEWPDYELKSVSKVEISSGSWLTEVQALSHNGFDDAVEIKVQDIGNKSKTVLARREDNYRKVILTNYEPELILIDPNRKVHDHNRFNNSNRATKTRFFPGDATKLEDDGYTVFWIPYATRRPAESYALGISSRVFKYLDGMSQISLEGYSDGYFSGLITNQWTLPHEPQSIGVSIYESKEGNRETSLTHNLNPVSQVFPNLALSTKFRVRNTKGVRDSLHSTLAFKSRLKLLSKNTCSAVIGGEYEKTINTRGGNFLYQKNMAAADMNCSTGRFTLRTRLFSGTIKSNSYPNSILFNPQSLGEARVRLDRKDIDLVKSVDAISNDVFFPMYVPLPSDLLILSNNLKGRLFFDIGKTREPDHTITAFGLGLDLPLGGDIVGVGAISLTKFSILSVLYSRIDDKIERKPHILFDLSGKL